MSFWKKVFFHSPVSYIIATCSGLVIALFYLWNNEFAKLRIGESFINSGIMVTLVGLLILCAFLGAFDTFAYGFHSLRNRKKRKFEDLVQYTQVKIEQRKKKSLPYIPFLVVGILYIILGIFLTLIIK